MKYCKDCFKKYSCNFEKGEACEGFQDSVEPLFNVTATLRATGQNVFYGCYNRKDAEIMHDSLVAQKTGRFSYIAIGEVN